MSCELSFLAEGTAITLQANTLNTHIEMSYFPLEVKWCMNIMATSGGGDKVKGNNDVFKFLILAHLSLASPCVWFTH